MTEKLEPAIVRICGADRKYRGFGVLVSDKRILTCAHVVGAALGLDREQQIQKPTEPVYFDFPFIAPGKIQTARVIFWCPVQEKDLVIPEQAEDIAGLEIDDLPPPEAEPIQLRSFQAIELEGHPFEVFGTHGRHPHGAWATGVVLKRLPNGWIQFENKDQSGYSVAPGVISHSKKEG